MKTPNSDSNDPALRAMLRAAHPAPSLPPRFQEGVWKRLERVETTENKARSGGWLEQLVRRMLQPAYATAMLTAVMLAGTWMGVRDGDQAIDHVERGRYVAAVSPFPTIP